MKKITFSIFVVLFNIMLSTLIVSAETKDLLIPYSKSGYAIVNDFSNTEMSGESYKNAAYFGLGYNGLYYGGGEVHYNLSGKYDYIQGIYGAVDTGRGSSSDYAQLDIYGDGVKLDSLIIKGGQLAKSFELNVKGVKQLDIYSIETEKPGFYEMGAVAVAEVYGYKKESSSAVNSIPKSTNNNNNNPAITTYNNNNPATTTQQ